MGAGAIAILVAVIAAIPGTAALWAARRKETDETVFNRDKQSWDRMLDSVARTDKDLEDLRKAFVDQAAQLADWKNHAHRCDRALAVEQEHSREQDKRILELERQIGGGV